jgi:hypothetical protein
MGADYRPCALVRDVVDELTIGLAVSLAAVNGGMRSNYLFHILEIYGIKVPCYWVYITVFH